MTTGWSVLPFAEVFEDVSAGQPKTLARDFLAKGRFPLVDQGQRPIGGYTNDEERLASVPLPVIVFGDHTRTVKYVDFRFGVGADGVKLLRPRGHGHVPYFFRFLQAVQVPAAGYDRHFKYLKRVQVPVPPLEEQRRIAAILDQADELRTKRQTSLALIDSLSESMFLEVVGESDTSEVTLGAIGDVQGGLQVTHARARNPIEVPYLRVANVHRARLDLAEVKPLRVTEAELTRTRLLPQDLLVVEGHGNATEIGRVARWTGAFDPCVHQNHLIRVRVDPDRAASEYVEAYLNSRLGRPSLLRAARTTSGLNTISVKDVKAVRLPLPRMAVQRSFAAQRAQIDRLAAVGHRHEADLDALFASLQQRAFAGQL